MCATVRGHGLLLTVVHKIWLRAPPWASIFRRVLRGLISSAVPPSGAWESSRRVKILHVYKTYLPDNFEGISRVIWEIAEGARAYGVESEVLSLSSDPWPSTVLVGHHLSHRAKQDLFIASTAISFSVLRRFRELAAGADLVHFHFPWPMADLMQVLGRHHRPAIATYHSDVVRQRLLGRLYRPLMHRFLGQLEAIVATSPAYAVTSPVLQLYSDKVRVIPLGISEAPPPDAARLAYWRDRLGTGFLLFVGALRYYKGLTILNEAARLTALRSGQRRRQGRTPRPMRRVRVSVSASIRGLRRVASRSSAGEQADDQLRNRHRYQLR